MKRWYSVSFQVTYSAEVEAESPAEAADLVAEKCPYDIDSFAFVSRAKDDNPNIILEWDEESQTLPDTDDGDE